MKDLNLVHFHDKFLDLVLISRKKHRIISVYLSECSKPAAPTLFLHKILLAFQNKDRNKNLPVG